MKDFLEKIEAAMKALRARANKAIEDLPPVDQIEAGQEVIGALRTMDWMRRDIEEISGMMEGKLEDILSKFESETAEAAMTKALKEGELVKKEDHEALLDTARNSARDEARKEAEDESKKLETVAARRKKAAETVGEIAAAVLSDEALSGDDWEDSVKAMKARIDELSTAGIQSDKQEKAFKVLVAMPLGDDAKADFDAKLEAFKEVIAPAGNQRDTARKTGNGGAGGTVPSTSNAAPIKVRVI